jgi:hypothetical protein
MGVLARAHPAEATVKMRWPFDKLRTAFPGRRDPHRDPRSEGTRKPEPASGLSGGQEATLGVGIER